MGTPKTIVALYRMAHIQMLGALKAIFNLFVADKADFADPFETNWQTSIVLAENMQTGEMTGDILITASFLSLIINN